MVSTAPKKLPPISRTQFIAEVQLLTRQSWLGDYDPWMQGMDLKVLDRKAGELYDMLTRRGLR